MSETIVAPATPNGRSSIGVIRLSGPAAVEIVKRLTASEIADARVASLRRLFDIGDGDIIDEAVVTYFKGPHSFTGEDVVEIACHGSPIVLRRVIDVCLRLGARMAEAGEFSLRALANGRMDLSEAEAVRDLIAAQTTASARQAVRQLRGELSHQLQPVKDEVLDAIVVLESALEFVEDDLPAVQAENVKRRLSAVAESIERLAATFHTGRLIRHGLVVTLVGRPNVGKSSLFNTLVGTDRAIVTNIAGTTRDQINESLTIDDVPILLVDTAGLRDTSDTVEKIGVERSRRAMADADLVVVLLDASEELARGDADVIAGVGDSRHLFVFNKVDKLAPARHSDQLSELKNSLPPQSKSVFVSAKTGEGIDELKRAIIEPFFDPMASAAGFLITDARHFDLLVRAEEDISESLALLERRASEEIVLVGLHNALRFLGQITGETTTEDMLTRIFSTFCIGK